MKKIYTLLLAVLPSVFLAQTTISCDSILQTSTCAGGNVIVSFQTTGTFPWGNNFTAELSDNWGNWGNPVAIGSTPFVIAGNGIIFAQIPVSANFGVFYRVRVVSSNPADTSNDSPNTLIVTQVAQLNQVISDPGDSACPGDTITLYALNPASSYLWSTGDTTWSIQVTTSGIYSVTTTDILTCESTATDTIVFDPQLCTGIGEQSIAPAFNIYPNPAGNEVAISFDHALPGDAYIEIKDVTGRTVLSFLPGNSNTNSVSVEMLGAGLYLVVLHSDNVVHTQKLIVE